MHVKWLIRLSFPALGLLLLLIFFGLGDPQQVSEPAKTEQAENIPSFEGLLPSPIPTEGPDIVFKWQDTDGNWHYADQPPAQGPWNALAIERPEPGARQRQTINPEDDWQAPYQAPYSLNGTPANGS
ncbi:DUF4124 domain-containing protein [Marinobacter sp. VGCF2001]|uniref:DUF4124 domain-containing protein n=1 Tax=Marinobacter sp. VGCF2001 TaxID=3417189 RepID=UPI003CE97493